MPESDLYPLIQAAASAAGHRLFRCNVGQGWVGEIIAHAGNTITLKNPRPLHAGMVEGQSDLIGWTRDGRFAAIEVKKPGARTKKNLLEKQEAFIKAVNDFGGRAGFARSVDEAMEILDGRP